MSGVADWRVAIEAGEQRVRDLQREVDLARRERIPDRDRVNRLARQIDQERRRIIEFQSYLRQTRP